MELPDPILPRPRSPRLVPSSLETALVALRRLEEPFTPDAAALIHDQTESGCALVLHDRGDVIVGEACLVKVGSANPVAAQICWKRTFEGRLLIIGLQFLE